MDRRTTWCIVSIVCLLIDITLIEFCLDDMVRAACLILLINGWIVANTIAES